MIRFLRVLTIILAGLIAGCQSTALSPGPSAPILEGLGTHHMGISSPSAEAQRYFNQGLILAYGFNHAEAGRSFRAAAELDPQCAICYWGQALVLGPNINAPMDTGANGPAWAALQKARELSRSGSTTAKERALIEALSQRYAETPPEDRSALDLAYAKAMRQVARRYPNDPDVQTLFAEALMDTTPWDYWESDDTPRPETTELVAAIEAALREDLHHPGANHLYIHAVESVHPERGLAAAQRLDGLVPGAGHLVHMPGHIYIRTGRYHDAVRVNQLAAQADERYIAQCKAQGAVPLGYYPHNLHFLWFAAMMGGESAVAIETAEKIQATLTDDMIEVQRLRPALVFALVRFGRWEDLLNLSAPPEEHLYARAMWHYGRGLAQLNQGQEREARVHLASLAAIVESEAGQDLEQPYFFGLTQVRIAQHILSGEIAGVDGGGNRRIAELRAATALQDELPYMEPPYWYFPVRHSLGGALLQSGRAAEAETVYREDLAFFAENGWSLAGLAQSLRIQNRTAEAEEVEERYARAWKHADL